jgi:hypothetical protein
MGGLLFWEQAMVKHSVLAVVALAAGSAALADDRTYAYECDAPQAHHSSWTATTKATAITITGTLRINEIRQDKKYAGVVYVYVKGGDDAKTQYGFRGYDADDNQSLFWKILKPGGHEDIGKKPLKAGSKRIPFRLELTTTGTLRAKVGEGENSVELGTFTPKSISLGCSTGDFSFADVRIVETPAG